MVEVLVTGWPCSGRMPTAGIAAGVLAFIWSGR